MPQLKTPASPEAVARVLAGPLDTPQSRIADAEVSFPDDFSKVGAMITAARPEAHTYLGKGSDLFPSLPGIIDTLMKRPLNWENWRRSDNIEDRRAQSALETAYALSGSRPSYDNFKAKYGFIPTYNAAVRQLNQGRNVPGAVLSWINSEVKDHPPVPYEERQGLR